MENKKEWAKITRRVITFTLLASVLLLGFLTASYPIYLEVLKQISIPFGIVVAGHFGNDMVKNSKFNNQT